MAANKTRVPVRGTIGKSVQLPTGATAGGAIIGVNLKLPNGTVPTLQQLAAALTTGAALQDQPGNITPPGSSPAVVWQNIQYVPPQIKYPARYVAQDDEPEDRLIIPGPQGLRGLAGLSATPFLPDDPEDALFVPGTAGKAGNAGAPGVTVPNNLYADDAEDPGLIPGAAGPPGINGQSIQGSPGVNIALFPDDGEDPLHFLGPQGNPGTIGPAGGPGVAGAVGAALFAVTDDPEDPLHFLGPQGNAGLTGQAGAPGVTVPNHMYMDDPEDPGLIPGAAGPPGINGQSIQGAPGVLIPLTPDDSEDPLNFQGAQGNVGKTGAAGNVGPTGSALWYMNDDPEDPPYIAGPPGAVGATGAQGIPGTSSSSSGGGSAAALLDYDLNEDYVAQGMPQVWPGGNLTVNGRFVANGLVTNGNLAAIIDTGTSSTTQLLLSAVNDSNGANFQITGNGGTTPSKFLRVQGGIFQIINSAYGAAPFALTDAGSLTIACTSGVAANFTSSGINAVAQFTAPSTFTSTLHVMGNGVGTGKSLMLQQDTAQNGYLRQQDTGSLFLGTGASNWASVNATGNWTFTTPSSGIAMTVNGTSAIQAVQVNSGANPMAVLDSTQAAGGYVAFTRSGTAYGHIGNGGALGSTTDHMAVRATTALDFLTNAGAQLAGTIASAGNWTIEAPTGGVALTVNALAGQLAAQFTGGANGYAVGVTGSSTSGQSFGLSIAAGSTSADAGLLVSQIATNNPLLKVTGAGAIQAPASPLVSTATQAMTGLANFKASTTTVANNTLVADASLTVTVNEVGWYRVDALLYVFEATSGAGGVQFDINGGTAVLANGLYTSTGISNGAAYANSARAFTVASNLTPCTTSSTTPDWSLITGMVHVTTAGTVAIRWAQGTTLGIDPTSAAAGSAIILTKIG